ncbi:MAG: tetratricopeptide repeat protein, partial [Pirellulaceae bacterium]|nr:tetratricopeptide repeat protein [Pirellulaceae bacterium]
QPIRRALSATEPVRYLACPACHQRMNRKNFGGTSGIIADLCREHGTWFNRGELRYEQGDFNGAVQDYSQALRIAPKDAAAYNSRGHAYYRLGGIREAMRDYDQAVRLNPRDAAILTNRGDAHAFQGNYALAAQDFREAIRLDNQLGRAYQSAAWLMATCPDQRFRSPQLGLDSAKKAIELDGDEDFRYLETLAAAYANAGQFEEARQTQAQALEKAPEQDLARFKRRLDLYSANRPYRESGNVTQAPRQIRSR